MGFARPHPARTTFPLVGSSDGEEIWEGISTEQALALVSLGPTTIQ
jgi:hypothetical protein